MAIGAVRWIGASWAMAGPVKTGISSCVCALVCSKVVSSRIQLMYSAICTWY